MSNYAYIRVSTDKQDLESQKHGLLFYANQNDLTKLEIIEDVVSSRKAWRDRAIGTLVSQLKTGDQILTPEISRLARSTLEALEIIQEIIKSGASLHITKDGRKIGGDIQDTIYITVLALAAEIERDFIRKRTQESLDKRKQQLKEDGYFISSNGNRITKLGRPKGALSESKLAPHKAQIIEYLEKGISKAAICKLLDTTQPTLRKFIKDHALDQKQGNLPV